VTVGKFSGKIINLMSSCPVHTDMNTLVERQNWCITMNVIMTI